LAPELLTKQSVVFVLTIPSEVLVGVTAFECHELTGLGIVREPNGPSSWVVTNVELLAGVLLNGPGLEGDDVPSEVHMNAGEEVVACGLLTCCPCVVAAGEAMLMAI
jgi:hypothetical protein